MCIVNSFVSADRRATARTTTSLSHAAIRQKKEPLEEDGSGRGGPGCTPIGRGRPRGAVQDAGESFERTVPG